MQRKVKKDLSAVNSQLSLELEVHQTAKQNLKNFKAKWTRAKVEA